MRLLYAERQAALVEAASHQLSGLLEVRPSAAGMHLVAWLPEGVGDVAVAERCADAGISAPPLTYYMQERPERGALMLGYTAVSKPRIKVGVQQLAAVLHDALER